GGFQSGFGLLHDRECVARMAVVARSEGSLGLSQLMLGERFIGHRDAQRGVGLIVLLDGVDALFLQRLGAHEIDFRLLELRHGKRPTRSGRIHQRVELIDGLPGALELRLGLLDTDVQVAWIQRQQQLAFLNRPVVLDINVGDGAGNPRGNQCDSAVDVGVVGADVAFDVAIVVKTGNRGGGGDNDRHYQQDPAYELRIHRRISEAGRSRRVFEWLAHLLQRLTMTNAEGCQTNRDDRARRRRSSRYARELRSYRGR